MDPDFDPAPLHQLAADLDVETTKEIIASYLGEAPTLLAAAVRSLRQNNIDEFRRAVHTLKSTSANMGATRLSESSKRLEAAAREGRLPTPDAVQELEVQFDAIRPRLLAWNG
jgi:HPt (histidine-containing phosphotransfer) domain-containing protein